MNTPHESIQANNPRGGEPITIDVYVIAYGVARAVVRETDIEVIDQREVAIERVWLKFAMFG